MDYTIPTKQQLYITITPSFRTGAWRQRTGRGFSPDFDYRSSPSTYTITYQG
ncbi:hypothetical protein [Perlabentimonas gracilis]|uniref:hypothetical protein n=1 Tax=Perlabentimonas gracilis TaxID=2715279 RepID=UPI00140B6520|nr:hypothetical protein [Perlabentimonas gracilis]NHB70353.1 hypothetical protein [Perlabentimonas gracilis]